MSDTFGYSNAYKRNKGGHIPFVNPKFEDQWWGYLFAVVPAFLLYILLFLETEITEVLLAKKERGMRKGSGFHWDLVLMSALAFVCSVFGLPWLCAAPAQSLAHAGALAVMKKTAPGEKPQVDHVIEQRVTTILVAVLTGVCAFLGRLLKYIPQATMFGVFLYLGVVNLLPIALIHRLVLFFVPEKYYPNVPYTSEVSMWRMHLYTAIQTVCLIGVYLVKHFKVVSIAFPFALIIVALFRLFALPRIFTKGELEALDEHGGSDDEDDAEALV